MIQMRCPTLRRGARENTTAYGPARLALALAIVLAAFVAVSPAWAAPPALVAAYSFDAGAGTTVADQSGNGHVGTISGATWTTGKNGAGLSFDGTSASVNLGGLGTFYQSGFTLEAWVKKTSATKNDVAVVGTWTGSGGPMVWVDHIATRYHLTLGSTLSTYLDSGRNPVAGTWQHLAATYDGTTARFYVDGTEVATRTFSGSVGSSDNWRIGAYGASPTGFFDGVVDDVRIYDGALTAAAVQDDMNTGVPPYVPPPDTTPPSAPGTLNATVQSGDVSLSWGAATDNVGVAHYDVHRSTTSGFTPSAGNRIAQPTGTSYTDPDLAAGSYYYKVVAEDAAGNDGPASNQAAAAIDSTPPTVVLTAPAAGTVAGLVTVSADATDNSGIAGVRFKVDGDDAGAEDTTAPYSITWDSRTEVDGTHQLTAVARDIGGNTTTSPAVQVTVTNGGGPTTGLVAAYSFDDGSGTVARDSSSGHRNATLAGAGWTASGKYGAATTLNGSSAQVDVPALGTFYKSAFTLEAWVRKDTFKNDAAVVGAWDAGQGGGAMIWVDHLTGHYRLTLGPNFSSYLDSGRTPVVGQWQHLAATYDGTTARFYVDGVQTATTTFSGNVGDANVWRIGAYGTSSAAGFFDGRIDNVRIYDRALTGAEVEDAMATRVAAPDLAAPSAPTGLGANASFSQVSLTWTAASDNVGVARYNVHRGTTSGFTPGPTNRVGQPTGPSFTDSGLAPGTYYYKVTAEDATGNVGPASGAAGATTTADTTPPTVNVTAPAAGSVAGIVTVTASASDNQAIAGVQFKLDGQSLGAEDTAAPYELDWDTRAEYNGDHAITAVARDASGNATTSSAVAVTVANAGVSTTGLRAAYGLDDATGGIARDSSGNNKTATLSGAAWTSAGRFGGALALNGTSARADLPALGTFYKTGVTLEAWVRKTTAAKDTAVLGSWDFGQGGGAMIWVDHQSGHYRLTLGTSMSNFLDSGRTPVVGQWQHLAATYDGTSARFYVDGVQTATTTYTGNVGDANVWRIGAYGTSAGSYFDGTIDNVRIYDRALSASEVQLDMASRVPAPDTTPPSATGTLTATGGYGEVALSWGAATDNVGVVAYDVYRGTTAGFTPSVANRVAQPSGATYTDAGIAPGTYYYRVQAEDSPGNVGPLSNEASGVAVADTTAPAVALTAPTAGAVSGLTAVSANASDNHHVAGVQFKLDGASLGAEDTTAPYSVTWDTRAEINGSHTLTAVARDASGNTTTSAGVAVTVDNAGVSSTGLRAAYGFDEGSGGFAIDSSGNGRTATLAGAGWAPSARFGAGITLSGSVSDVDLPPLGTFYSAGFTYEAWVLKQTGKRDVAVVGSWTVGQAGGPMIWVDFATGRYKLTLGGNPGGYLDSGVTPALGQWQHVAATYDGAVARFYVDGALVASQPFTGNIGSANSWRIGAYGVPATGFFDGNVDNVRIYDRPLTTSEIQLDMVSRVQPELSAPTVTSTTPSAGANEVMVSTPVTALFSKPMQASTITSSTFTLRDGASNPVPASVSYDAPTRTATLTPQYPLSFSTTYTARLVAGGPTDLSGNPLAADVAWSFTTEASRPPILLVTSAANPFSSYTAEILRAEGLNSFSTADVSSVTSSFLSGFSVVVLGDVSLTTAQASALTAWVSAGGNLVALRPDKQLAGLLGLTDDSATLTNAYLKVDTTTSPGEGIVGQTIQFHGTADRYTLNGATAVATLYSDATTATASPAVTLRAVGSAGGDAAAFTYDLSRSVVLTHQGNPAWAGTERDGVTGIRPSDLFYGAKVGDVQPDWVDTSKIAIPQADEQQRLLANLITSMVRDKLPLPRFWYLPRGAKAAVVLTGDDHSPVSSSGATASNFDRFKQLSAPGCVVALWQCVRATSYILPNSALTPAEANAYVAEGFEVGLHPVISGAICPTTSMTAGALGASFDTQLAQFAANYPSVPAPVTSRTHCVYWPDWASAAHVELARGIRVDTNYYHYPGPWLNDKPGFITGGGFPMRFADLDGSTIDVYQASTFMQDETGQPFPSTVDALLDNAVGPNGYYGTFTSNVHTDFGAPQVIYEAMVASAQARGVPLITEKQLLDWTDGRNNSTIGSLAWSNGTLTFTATVAAGANGLRTMLPVQGPAGTLSGITHGGSAVSYTVQTIKGVQYAMFATASGTYTATYS
jgi:Concanavalin A-like lectin/glucanases superfamily/Bacterial Ig-like domain/Bacterial Ig domain